MLGVTVFHFAALVWLNLSDLYAWGGVYIFRKLTCVQNGK